MFRRRGSKEAERGEDLALARLELQLIQCIRSFTQNPDTPTMAIPVAADHSADAMRLEGKAVVLTGGEFSRPRSLAQLRRELDAMQGDAVVNQDVLARMRAAADQLDEGAFSESDQLHSDMLVDWWKQRPATSAIDRDALGKLLRRLYPRITIARVEAARIIVTADDAVGL